VKATHGDWDSGVSERSGDVESPRVLVRLDADKRYETKSALPSVPGNQSGDVNAAIRFVDGLDIDRHLGPEDLAIGAIGGDGINGSEGIGGYERSPPTDHIAIVIVV
jgi:hypothetical protein